MSQRLMKEYGGTDVVHEKNPKKIEAMFGIRSLKRVRLLRVLNWGGGFLSHPGAETG